MAFTLLAMHFSWYALDTVGTLKAVEVVLPDVAMLVYQVCMLHIAMAAETRVMQGYIYTELYILINVHSNGEQHTN